MKSMPSILSEWGFLCAISQGKFSVKPSVFVTSKHYNPGLKRNAASVWIDDLTKSSCKVCMRELQNYAGSHRDIFVVSMVYRYFKCQTWIMHWAAKVPNLWLWLWLRLQVVLQMLWKGQPIVIIGWATLKIRLRISY